MDEFYKKWRRWVGVSGLQTIPDEDGGSWEMFTGISGGSSGEIDLSGLQQELNTIGTHILWCAMNITTSTTAIQGVGASIDELEGELITLEGIFTGWAAAYGLQCITFNMAFQELVVAMVAGFAAVAAASWTQDAIDQLLDFFMSFEDTLKKAFLFSDGVEGDDAPILKAGLLFQDQDGVKKGALERGLLRTLTEDEPPDLAGAVKSLLADLDAKLEVLETMDVQIDVGPLRAWIKNFKFLEA